MTDMSANTGIVESTDKITRKKQREYIEAQLAELPVVQYAWVSPEDIPFSERVRSICREECPRYGTSWACPPGVGSVEACREQCLSCSGALVFTTIAEVTDIENMEETLATRAGHEDVTREIGQILSRYYSRTLALSGESCAICPECAYPDEPCRHPEKMIPCIEGYGIIVPILAEKAQIEFMNGGNVVTWFGIVLFAE